MLDASKVEDIKEISRYGKGNGFLIAKRYGLPTYSNFYILENKDDVEELLNKYENQSQFCMRSDTLVGNTPIGIGGENGNRETIFEYFQKIRQKAEELQTKGVAIIYWNNGKFCPTNEVEGCFYLDYRTKENLFIDYVGKGWDGSFLSHGTACHESYIIPWDEILFFTANNRLKYRKNIVGEEEYSELRRLRIKELNKKLPIEECEKTIPKKYLGIKNEYFRQVIDQVIIPMYDSPELQRYYKEYIPIAQIEDGKVLVPEVIIPARLKYRKIGEGHEER